MVQLKILVAVERHYRKAVGPGDVEAVLQSVAQPEDTVRVLGVTGAVAAVDDQGLVGIAVNCW